jgi:hypothetical protein
MSKGLGVGCVLWIVFCCLSAAAQYKGDHLPGFLGLESGTQWGRLLAYPGASNQRRRLDDLYFGPKAPDGKQSNWIPTKAGEKFEIIFRLGPQKRLFGKT